MNMILTILIIIASVISNIIDININASLYCNCVYTNGMRNYTRVRFLNGRHLHRSALTTATSLQFVHSTNRLHCRYCSLVIFCVTLRHINGGILVVTTHPPMDSCPIIRYYYVDLGDKICLLLSESSSYDHKDTPPQKIKDQISV